MLKTAITFYDIFNLAFANTKKTLFSSMPLSWHNLFFDVSRRYPDIMSGTPQKPKGFSGWVKAAKEANLVSQPSFRFFKKDEQRAKELIAVGQAIFKEYESQIAGISRMIDERLAIRK